MQCLSLFSGIGGIELAAEWAGFRTVAFVEREPFCQKVLAKHWPGVPIYDDITTFDAEPFRGIDLVTGGFPCQDISAAGKQAGLSGERSGLWFEMLRVVAQARPVFVVAENVANLVSMGIDVCLSGLESEGYAARAVIVPACSVGAVHKRERCFIIARNSHYERCEELDNREPKESKNANGGYVADAESYLRRTSRHDGPKPSDRRGYVADASGARRQQESESSFGDETSYGQEHDNIAPSLEQNTADAPYTENIAGPQANSRTYSEGSRVETRSSAMRGVWRPIRSGDWRTWGVEPVLRRGDDGLSNRVDRLRSLGNAVVPQQVYPILEAIAKELRG